jgi:phosphoserine phosphatase
MSQLVENSRPLCVDLDGTLIKGDTMSTSIVSLLRRRPWMALPLILWRCIGLVYFKRRLVEQITVDPRNLRWRQEVIEFVRQERAKGRQTVLATASNIVTAKIIAEYLGCFDHIVATDRGENLRGRAKARAIRQLLGTQPYDYMGDSYKDLPVWNEAAAALLVAPSPSVEAAARKVANVTHVFTGRPS